MKKTFQVGIMVLVAIIAFTGCQKMKKPELGNYLTDANPPNGPLKFYAAFDGSTTNPLMNAVDSIKANFPSDNPFTSIDGIRGKGLQGVNQKFVKYPSFNAWAASSSMSISVWFKQNGQTQNNFHWSNAVGFVFLEGNNTACAVKTMFVSKTGDNWFTWEGGQSIPGLCDNQWHHMVVTYDETNGQVKLYIDGVQNPNIKSWGSHGALNLASDKITEYRVGAGPSTNYASDDWLACSFKGGLDQLRLYSVVLTPSEIQALYTGKQ